MKAVVLAAGKGTRLGEVTKNFPKPMIKIKEKPILQIIIENLKKYNIEEIILVVNYNKEKIINYFGDGSKFGVKIRYVVQEKLLGTADALRYVEPYINEDYFLLIYGDLYFDFRIIPIIVERNSPMMCIKKVENPERFGAVRIEGNKVVEIFEKSKELKSNFVNTGIYILPKEIFSEIKNTKISKRGEYELTDSIQQLIDKGVEFNFVVLNRWFDIGTLETSKMIK